MSTTLIDPRFWLVVIITAGGIAFLSYQTGTRHEAKTWIAKEAKANAEAYKVQAEETVKTASKNMAMVRSFENLTDKREKERQDDQVTINTYRSALLDGSERMWLPVRSCRENANAGSAAPGNSEARGELTSAAAIALDTIAGDGDEGIKDLNTCIDKFNAVRILYNERR